MKNVVLAIAVALVLVAIPAAAQYDTSAPATTTTTTTSSTTTTPTDEATTETRTNATAPMHSNDPGLTANGNVVSWNDEEVVLKSASGLLHLKLLPTTTGSRTFSEGQSLSIDYSRNEQGVLLAKQIRSGGELTTPATTTPGAAVPGSVGATASNVGEAVEEGVEETVGADVDKDGAIGTRGAPTGSGTDTASTSTTTTESTAVDTSSNLPATGSNGPLVGLLGLLALGGAAAIRRL